jgi:hypothetical protein
VSAAIDYRIGDYASFRHALLRAADGELALAGWQPGVEGDLGVQLLEWWAYLADILAFYNERALSSALLRTAVFPEDIQRTIRLLGYRPRPGIGATGALAALTDAARPFAVARGLPIQGPGPLGAPPQVFELDQDVEIGMVGGALPASARLSISFGAAAPSRAFAGRLADGSLRDAVPARDATLATVPALTTGVEAVVAVDGIVTNLAAGDRVVVMPRKWDGVAPTAVARVAALAAAWDTSGNPVTALTLDPLHDYPGGAPAADATVVKPTKTAHLWLYHDRYPGPKAPQPGSGLLQGFETAADPLHLFSGGASSEPAQDAHVLTSEEQLVPDKHGAAHLEGITRGINPGDPVLFEQVADGKTLLTQVAGYDELIWFANPPEPDRIGQGPPIGPPSGRLLGGTAPIPIPHSKLTFVNDHGDASRMSGADDAFIRSVVVHYAWEEIGAPAQRPGDQITTPEIPADAELPPGTPAVIEDATGAGVAGAVGRTSTVDTSGGAPGLVGPLRALLNLLPVSRGESVAGEVLGSGDAAVARQEFALSRSPLTYLADTGPSPFDGYRSTLRVRVGGVEWHEVASFYGQPADARVFATREDAQQRTYVRFGDGVHGARLPAGADNVVADYRVGSGADVPAIGTLTTIMRPQPGLASIRNPIAPGGGADSDPPEQIRRYAPRSVLTFGRAVSGDDYETVAAQTPGVARARAVWGWDADAQRSAVRVLVGDDTPAVSAARGALRAFADPNRPVVVSLAAPVHVDLTLVLEVDRDYEPDAVREAARAALLDPRALPFGSEVVRIGSVVYDSEIYDACFAVPGVVAVHGLGFRVPGPWWWFAPPTERHAPGDERFYLLNPDGLRISAETSRHDA